MSDHLRNAMDKRFEGDYEYTTSVNKDEANNLLKTGQEFIKKMIQYLDELKHI